MKALSNLFKEYFHYLTQILKNTLVVILGLIVFGFLFLQKEDLTILLQLATLSFFIVVYLSLYYGKSSFNFFNKFFIAEKISVFAVLGAMMFVIAYSYKFIFTGIDMSHQALLSLLMGFIFVLGIVFTSKDVQEKIHTNYFHLAHHQRIKILNTVKYTTSIMVLSIVVVMGVLSWTNWEKIVTSLQISRPSLESDFGAPLLSRENSIPETLLPSKDENLKILSTDVPLLRSGVDLATNGLDKPIRTIGEVFISARYLGIGDIGNDVEWIQNYLKKTGYYQGKITRTFDSATSQALNRFMQAKTGVTKSYLQLGPKNMAIFKKIKVE